MRQLSNLAAIAVLFSAGLAEAATPAEACADLGEARAQLVAMIAEPDVAKLDDYKAKIHAASNALDADLAGMAGGPDAGKAEAFKPVWEAFPSRRRGRPRSFLPSTAATRTRPRASRRASRRAA